MVLAAIACVAIVALLVNIFERKQEAKNPFYRVVELNDSIDDPATWGKDFPLQYDLYLRTVDMQRTKYGGSEAMPHSPTDADPRSVVARSKLEQDPRLKIIWAGYPFSIDYRERRGHAYMLQDQTFTQRQNFNPPAMCINCHASMVTTFLKLGDGDLAKGFNVVSDSHMTYPEIRKDVKHPVACIDCHDPKTMQLRVTRPAFMEGIRALKASEGVQNYDVNTMATRQEMRSYVCGQCHVTYFFQPPNKRLTFPWANGIKVEDIIAYEDEHKINEWTHAETGAQMIKPRHPEFEMWNQGVHARSGVACAELKARAEDIQDRYFNLRNTALDALVDLIEDIKAEKAKGATDAQLAEARTAQRKSQFMIDFVMSENSMGFHAPQEATRILGDAINISRIGQLSLHGGPKPSHNPPIENVTPSPASAAAPTKQAKVQRQVPIGAWVGNP